MARIYVMRGEDVIVLSRRRPAVLRLRPVRRPWDALAELSPPPPGRPPGDTALVFAPPLVLGALAAAFAPAAVGIAVGGVALVASTYLTPTLRRTAAGRRLRRPENIVLRGDRARTAFDRTLATADRVSETWPALGPLVDPGEASILLAEALWQVAAVLARREELDAVLAANAADLGDASIEVRSQASAAKAARTRVQADFVRREASLRRAEDAGRDFIREQHMRAAVRAADRTLRSVPSLGLPTDPPTLLAGQPLALPPDPPTLLAGQPLALPPDPPTLLAGQPLALPPATPHLPSATSRGVAGSIDAGRPAGLDAGADLAEQTRSVLAAYRELTAGLSPD